MRNSLLFCAALLVAAPVFAQQTVAPQAAPQQSNRLTKEEAIAATDAADAKRIEALVKGDLEALDKIFAKDMIYTHSNGKVDTKESLLAALKEGKTKYLSVGLSDKKHQNYGNTVIIAGIAEIKVKAGENEVSFKARFTEVWTRQKGEWHFAAWQTTRLPEEK